jgi:hypothetical protein
METKQRSKSCDFNPVGQKNCVICIMEFEENSIITSPFACGHRFHRDCINAWIKHRINTHHRPNCVYCKSEVLIPGYSINLVPEVFEPSESQEENINEDYNNPPDRPDPVPKIYPLFPNQRKYRILLDSRKEWATYFNKFNNYNRLTTRRRSEGQINKDSTTLQDTRVIIERLDQMLTELND